MRKLTMSLIALAGLGIAAGPGQASAQDLTVTWADDSTSDVTFDPRVTQSRHEEQVIVQVFDQLVYVDENNAMHPWLATSWTMAPDAKSVTLKLRERVKFHDGTPFDAEAVKFTFDSIVDPATGSQGAIDILGPYERAEILGPHEIRIHYKRPFAAALNAFSENELSPVSPTAVRKMGNVPFGIAPVGTGPFRFVSWEKNRQVVLERNPDYAWAPAPMENKGPSKVAKIVHRYIPDASTRVAALERGEIDISDITPPLDMRRLRDSAKFKVLVGNAGGLPYGALLNTSRGPFADLKVRQAFMMAVDRPKLAQSLFFGFADAAWGPLSASTPGYWPGVEKYYGFDRAKAEALLDEAGWKAGPGGVRVKDGKPLQVYFPALLEPETAVALQGEARRAGFDVKVENVLKAKQDELIFANDYDILVIRWVHSDPSMLEIPFHSRNVPEPGKFKFNWARMKDPALDKLLEDAASAPSPEARAQLYHEAQKAIMDRAIYFAVHNQVQTIAHSARIAGLHFAVGNWQVRLYDVKAVN